MAEYRCSHCGGTPAEFLDYLEQRPIFACAEHLDEQQALLDEQARKLRLERLAKLSSAAGGRINGWHLGRYAPDAYCREWTDPVDPKILAEIRDWLDNYGPEGLTLYLHGDVGVGKTVLAYATARAFVEERDYGEAEWVSVRPLLAAIKASFNGGPPVEVDLGPNTRLVVLDDLGAERVTEWTRDWLANVIEQRYDHRVTTIVTTNYSPAKLAARLGGGDSLIGQRLVSRLLDAATVIEMRGDDKRKRIEAA